MITEKQAAERRLQAYITRRLSQESDTIAPELYEYVIGNDEQEVESAIASVKQTTAGIISRARQVAPDAYAANVREGISDQLPDVSGMDMFEYSKVRGQLGVIGRVDHGLFGPLG